MATFFTTAQVQGLQAANLYILGAQAYETPADQAYIERLGNVAVSCGFTTSTGRFAEAMKLHPFTTLVKFIEFVGGSTGAQANTQTVSVLPVPR